MRRWAGLALIGVAALFITGQQAKGYPRLETRLLSSGTMLADSAGSVRVVCRDHIASKSLGGADVTIKLRAEGGKEYALFAGKTGSNGSVDANFRVPNVPAGSYKLVVETAGLGERDLVEGDVRVERPVGILLTTDKPLYQPGQLIHIRALALWTANRKPVAKEDAVLEVDDSKGNKVFKKALQTSQFGVVSADFQLADEINMGPYTIRALIAGSEEQKTVTVDRYVLPKFKVTVETDKEFYAPGEVATGWVRADYVFGKPVSGATVELAFSKYDVGFSEFAKVTGRTDGEGRFRFEQRLPSHFVGQPLQQGAALMSIHAKVTDTADHTQEATRSVTVAQSGMIVNLIPERPSAVRGLDMNVFAVCSAPDGRPIAGARVWMGDDTSDPTRAAVADDAGIAVLSVPKATFASAGASGPAKLVVSARDAAGNEATGTLELAADSSEAGILLRPHKSLVRVGSDLVCDAHLVGGGPTATVFFDVIKDGRPVLTRSVDAVNGVARLTIAPTDDMAGTIRVLAYRLTYSGNIVRDSRVVFVSPSSDLAVKLTLDRESYRPGEKATLLLQVGRKGVSSVGLSIVDESVFALQDMQPGMERVYFMLEQELLHPRYEVHSITPGRLFEPADYSPATQRAAQALFAQAEPITGAAVDTNSYTKKLEPFLDRWSKDIEARATRIAAAVERWQDERAGGPYDRIGMPATEADWNRLVARGWLGANDIRDEWGRRLRVRNWEDAWAQSAWRGRDGQQFAHTLLVISAGLDGVFDTLDDITAYAGVRDGRGTMFGLGFFDNGQFIGQQLERNDEAWGFGGRGGGVFRVGRAREMDVDQAFAADAVMSKAGLAELPASAPMGGAKPESPAEPRMRQYFPETMYWNPELLTDENGRASIEIPLADSITTWRVSASAVNGSGSLGSSTVGLKVFQDFFVDIDLPAVLTQNDEINIPIAIYNYLPGRQKVRLVMETSDGIEFLSGREQTVEMGPSDVRAAYFEFRVKGLGRQKLVVKAYGDRLSDAMTREIDVLPDGRRETVGRSGQLNGTEQFTVDIPAHAIEDASNVLVRIYPGVMATAIDGLDNLLRMPFGCFEQTSSVTYPNVLVLDYMKKSKQITPAIQMKAEQYINLGYQRLLSFEVPGGGFEWFGNPPAHQVLTAYGLMEFADMAKVYAVDPNLLTRTRAWLESKQAADGTWTPDKGGIAEGAINRQSDVFKTTAYIAWALAHTGEKSPALQKATGWLRQHLAGENDPYGLALAANAFYLSGDKVAGRQTLEAVLAQAKRDGDHVYFAASERTLVYGSGRGGDVETTAIVALALTEAGDRADTLRKVIAYLIAAKDPNGTWYSTQATVFALKALIRASEATARGMNGEGRVLVNGKVIGTFVLTPEDYEVVRQFDARDVVTVGSNDVRIEYSGKSGPMYQIVGIFYVPWDKVRDREQREMDIEVKYDKRDLAANDTVTCRVSVAYRGPGQAANMVIVDLGIPPGFEVMTGDLQELVGSKVIQKFNLTSRQAILYFDKLEKGREVEFSYRLIAKYPLRARTPSSRVYQYYDPDEVTYSAPQTLTVSAGR